MGRSAVIALVIALAACDARLGAPSADVDGQGGGGGGGGGGLGPDAAIAAPDAPPACSNGRVVFLNFDGVTLTRAATDDATQNQASWLGVTTANVPQYHMGNSNRANQIQSITMSVQSILSSFPITVVTTRPATGPYVMIAFGGTSSTVGTVYAGSTADHDCGDLVPSDVGWVADGVGVSKASDFAVGAIGWALGLQGTNDPTDCMCEWANQCQQTSSHCMLHGPIDTTTSSSPSITCPATATTQDELGIFDQAFCQ